MCRKKKRSGITSTWVLFNRDNGDSFDIQIHHWWPGREYKPDSDGYVAVPFSKKQIKRAIKNENPFMTHVSCKTPHGLLSATSRCLPRWACEELAAKRGDPMAKIDVPNKKYGRDRALGLLCELALPLGYDVIELINGEPEFFPE